MIGGGVAENGRIYIVTGSAVLSLVTIAITAASQDLGNMRSTGVFQYYALLRGKTSAALRPPCQRPSVRRRGDLHITAAPPSVTCS